MNKLNLLNEAENLYLVENMNADKIAERLKISRRTVFNWIKKYNWNSGKVKLKDLSNQISSELYSFGTKLLNKVNDDLALGKELDKYSISAIENIIKITARNEKEQSLEKNNKFPVHKELTPEIIKEINEEILGWDGCH